MKITQNQTPWFNRDVDPVRTGKFKVRNNPAIPCPEALQLTDAQFRFWDGKQWLTWEGGEPSIFGAHESHQWCGLLSDPVFPPKSTETA